MLLRAFLRFACVCAVGGCATSFTGSAHIEGGCVGCESKCGEQGLEMAGMVYMGEYSSACVCELAGSASADSASVSGAAVGVAMQMRRQQEQHSRAATY
jgi:hypothetical protein